MYICASSCLFEQHGSGRTLVNSLSAVRSQYPSVPKKRGHSAVPHLKPKRYLLYNPMPCNTLTDVAFVRCTSQTTFSQNFSAGVIVLGHTTSHYCSPK